MASELKNGQGDSFYHYNRPEYSIFGPHPSFIPYDKTMPSKSFFTEPRKADTNGAVTLDKKPEINHPASMVSQPACEIEKAPVVPIHNDEKKPVRKYSKTFAWPHGGSEVSVTGDFDNWKDSRTMTYVKDSNAFVVLVDDLDSQKDILYKFIVDGTWCYDAEKDFVKDQEGNINNILYAH